MKVLMFGWEFPPHISGGLGTACKGLTTGLLNQECDVTFVMPHIPGEIKSDRMKFVNASRIKGSIGNLKLKHIDSMLKPYVGSERYTQEYNALLAKIQQGDANYAANIYEEAARYAEKAKLIAATEDHDIIHCHDWMTYKAGINAKKTSKKPLVVHIHATEFDRTGGNNNQYIYDIEREGMTAADAVIAVSQYTKNKVVEHYGINPEKVHVVHNAVEFNDNKFKHEIWKLKKHHKIVLFLGRVTLQKGPDWFLYAAQRALAKDPDLMFVFAGSGDMELSIIEKSAELGIADHILFTGFLKGPMIDKAYQWADLYVMPSVSEPFGITPLEAMRNGTPVIISKQSGVSEVVENAIKVDFWDTELMANEMVRVLHDEKLHQELKEKGAREVLKFDWNIPAQKCIDVYKKTAAVCGIIL